MYLLTKRIFDFITAAIALAILSPFFLAVAVIIKLDSKGPVFYLQERVGQYNRLFRMFKFRTMQTGADKKGWLTIGATDNRITRSGQWLRKYKLDELPQLINVLIGNMSLVGPRPEVPYFVSQYNEAQLQVLQAKPGITDAVSLYYFDEQQLIAGYENPEQGYLKEIMPQKLQLNLDYLQHRSFMNDFHILVKTIIRIFS